MRRSTAMILPILGIVGWGIAGADEPVHLLPHSTANVARSATAAVPSDLPPAPMATISNLSSAADRIDHLHKAAEHLQAAGLPSLAEHIRGLADTPYTAKPPTASGVTAGPRQQVLLQLKFLELSESALRRLGWDVEQTEQLQHLSNSSHLKSSVEMLRKEGLIRVLAEPKLVTVMERPVQFRTGGEVMLWGIAPDGTPMQRVEHYGTSVDFVPRLIGEDDLRVELRVEISEVDHGKTVIVAGKENPAIHRRRVDTTLGMKLGATSALVWPLRPGDDKQNNSPTTVTILLLSVEGVHAMAAVPSPGNLPR